MTGGGWSWLGSGGKRRRLPVIDSPGGLGVLVMGVIAWVPG